MRLLSCLLLCALSVGVSAETYRWTDSSGHVNTSANKTSSGKGITPTPAPKPTPALTPAEPPETSGDANPGDTGSKADGKPVSHWAPQVTDTWQLQLQGRPNTSYNVAVFEFDMFDTPAATIAALKAQGKHVVCYFSAGSGEDWRPDFSKFKTQDLGKPLQGWAGENWLDTRSANVRAIMSARMDLAKSKGCDGVDTDNVDGYTNDTGLPLSAATQLDYNRFLASEAHARGLAIGLKNNVEQVAQLASDFDFATNESCFRYKECAAYAAFTKQGKPVFQVEYESKYKDIVARTALCTSARSQNLRTLVLPQALDDSFRYSCD
ncbi:MAG: endo alpha-1,4 polygalactosaminidase [Desulfobulbus sp.]|nr:endo alpha-1,4 polygalactosaminidase [Desulfobulbus sp.]